MPVSEKITRDYEQLEHEDDSEDDDDDTKASQKRAGTAKWSRPTSRSKSVIGQRSRSLARTTSTNKLTGEVSILLFWNLRLQRC